MRASTRVSELRLEVESSGDRVLAGSEALLRSSAHEEAVLFALDGRIGDHNESSLS